MLRWLLYAKLLGNLAGAFHSEHSKLWFKFIKYYPNYECSGGIFLGGAHECSAHVEFECQIIRKLSRGFPT